MERGIISRSPQERIRGKKIFYFLTAIGKKQYTLKLLEGHKENYIYKRIYEELFFSEFTKPLKFFYTEKDFLTFLKESDITQEGEWAFIGDAYEVVSNLLFIQMFHHQKVNFFIKNMLKNFGQNKKTQKLFWLN